MITTSLCSYTFNDAPLLRGLLASVGEWSRKPDEIVLVDDGSDVPFEAEDVGIPLRVIRLAQNRGFTVAKQAGMSAARGDILLSLDCDMRLDADYLDVCARYLENPEVGMVSGRMFNEGSGGSLGRFIKYFTDGNEDKAAGETEFIPGAAFAVRRELFEAVGGFSGYAGRVCEDHALCSLLRSKGYKLLIAGEITCSHVRSLTRHAHCRRVWTWCEEAVAGMIRDDIALDEQLYVLLVLPMLKRVERCLEIGEPLLIYYDVLYTSQALLELCRVLVGKGIVSQASYEALAAALFAPLEGFARCKALLRHDLQLMRVLPSDGAFAPGAAEEGAADWNLSLCFMDILLENGITAFFEKQGVMDILREEQEQRTDFSSYFTAAAGRSPAGT